MKNTLVTLLYVLSFTACATHSAEPGVFDGVYETDAYRFLIAEEPREPRSIGSYTVKAYARLNDRFPYDAFLSGLVLIRDGTVEEVVFEDLDGDGGEEIIVICMSAGSGSYLSADVLGVVDDELRVLRRIEGVVPRGSAVETILQELR